MSGPTAASARPVEIETGRLRCTRCHSGRLELRNDTLVCEAECSATFPIMAECRS